MNESNGVEQPSAIDASLLMQRGRCVIDVGMKSNSERQRQASRVLVTMTKASAPLTSCSGLTIDPQCGASGEESNGERTSDGTATPSMPEG